MRAVTDDAPPLRTLVTDDDPLVRRLIRDTLQRKNITVIAEAATGREAVEPETVRSHLKSLYRKLGVRSRQEAVEAAGRLRPE